MNTYVCIWKQVNVTVEANTTYIAQKTAIPLLQKQAGRKRVRRVDIAVMLVKLKGERVVHVPTM